MTTITNGRPRAKDLLAQLSPDSYRMAYDAGTNLSLWLERQDPSYQYNDGLDAFERLLHTAGLVTRSRPEIGLWASTFKQFEEQGDNVRMLIPEVIARFWRAASFGRSSQTRSVLTSADELPGGALRPYAEGGFTGWDTRLETPIRLQDIVALTTPISESVYRSTYLVDMPAEQRMVRVAEAAEIPVAMLKSGEETINLRKYGRGLEQSYESLRRVNLDKVRLWITRLAIQNEQDKISDALSVLVNGDGNAGTAATNYQIKTDFDSTATGKTITVAGYYNWKMKWYPSYRLTHVFAPEADMLKLALLNIGGTAAPVYMANLEAQGVSNLLRDGVRFGLTTNVPTDKLVGLDASAALEQVVEIGSEINEIERWARRQTQAIYMTVVEGFAVFDSEATKTLELES